MASSADHTPSKLTSALEDYLETIYEVIRDHQVARVKDIVKARGVRAGSVTPAMRRLAELDLIRYVQREYITLTEEGQRQARRVYARHQLMSQLFTDVLKLPKEIAEQDACAMEHSLSSAGMDQLARLLEFLTICEQGSKLVELFHNCPRVQQGRKDPCDDCACAVHDAPGTVAADRPESTSVRLSGMRPGEVGVITQLLGPTKVRQAALELGLLPGSQVELSRKPIGDGPWIIHLDGGDLAVDPKLLQAVQVTPVAAAVHAPPVATAPQRKQKASP